MVGIVTLSRDPLKAIHATGTLVSSFIHSLKNSRGKSKLPNMSFNEVIAELPRLTFVERQILIRRALELDDPPLSAADEELVEHRLAEHHADPSSYRPLDELKRRLRSRSGVNQTAT